MTAYRTHIQQKRVIINDYRTCNSQYYQFFLEENEKYRDFIEGEVFEYDEIPTEEEVIEVTLYSRYHNIPIDVEEFIDETENTLETVHCSRCRQEFQMFRTGIPESDDSPIYCIACE